VTGWKRFAILPNPLVRILTTRLPQDAEIMTMKAITVLSTALILTLSGCASTDPYTGSARNEIISVQYGTVENVQQVAMAPSYGASSLIGGALGLLATSGHSTGSQVAGAAGGAALGALVSKETAGTGLQFTIRLVNGNTINIVTENQGIRMGDCVSVEQGQHANIRRVSNAMCTTPASHPAYPAMHQSNVMESAECHEAKQELLAATTAEATEIAYKKMQALCQS
jgi:outer membrane lipoprotein SlyB